MTDKTAPLAQKKRSRTPSQRALETKTRILDAAETIFARSGFDGTGMRDIAKLAQVPVGLVHHHGGAKRDLFETVVRRRAEDLASARLEELAQCEGKSGSLRCVLRCFLAPYVARIESGNPQWVSYGRLIALISTDPQWRDIAAQYFDPTAQIFVRKLHAFFPDARAEEIATAFVYCVSAMLALGSSRWRIEALSESDAPSSFLPQLLDFCEHGLCAALSPPELP